jgi:hypothetical protein
LAPVPHESCCHALAGTFQQGVGALGGATGPDRVVAGDRQHVADLAGLQRGAQGGVGAVDLVAGDPGGRDAGV